MEGAGRAIEVDGALQTFAETVEVLGALGDGQLAKKLEDLGGQQGWRLGLVRLSAGVALRNSYIQGFPRKAREVELRTIESINELNVNHAPIINRPQDLLVNLPL